MADGSLSFLQTLAVWADRFGYYLEYWFIILPIEGLARLWQHLNPRIYSTKLRVRAIREGRLTKKSDRFVIFSLYAPHQTPPFTETLFRVIERSRLNLIIVSSASLSSKQREALLARCHLLVERRNLGRDFGAYADGLHIVRQRCEKIERLIFLNDSLYFLEPGVDKLVAGLDGEDDVIGMTEVYQYHYHIGSFAISFGPRVLEHERFRRFWRKYRPITTRWWSIHRGELNLTQTVIRAGFRPKVLYYGARLYPHLKDADLVEMRAAMRLLPVFFRHRINAQFDGLISEQTDVRLTGLSSLSKIAGRLNGVGESFSELRKINIGHMVSLSHQTTTAYGEPERAVITKLARSMISVINTQNQMHAGGFLFMKYLGMPAFKRDIFYREVYRLEDVDEILSEMNPSLKDEIVADLRQKGTQRHLRGLKKILGRHGII